MKVSGQKAIDLSPQLRALKVLCEELTQSNQPKSPNPNQVKEPRKETRKKASLPNDLIQGRTLQEALSKESSDLSRVTLLKEVPLPKQQGLEKELLLDPSQHQRKRIL